jgi:hypothetical protein
VLVMSTALPVMKKLKAGDPASTDGLEGLEGEAPKQ